jgi:uncharacterized protein (DUF2252 family)
LNIVKSTRRYEQWLRKKIPLIDADLEHKHEAMTQDPFLFLRATFYRWMQVWPEVCPEYATAPAVLGVGDLHVENFGTWRDIEGRLVWGINDFDEVWQFPYTIDLVRLSASAHLAIKAAQLRIEIKDACDAILAGYQEGLAAGGRPFVLEEHHPWLRSMLTGVLRDPERYWAKLEALPAEARIPAGARRAIEKLLPAKGLSYCVAHRVAGLGSLGRERYVAIAEFHGGKIAREAKALAPSAAVWAEGAKSAAIHYEEILARSVRSIDPFVHRKGRWLVRRLAPDCSRVELSSMPKQRDETRLLRCMGFETANVHLGSPKAAGAILHDLRARPRHWLHRASADMVDATMRDWETWRAKP